MYSLLLKPAAARPRSTRSSRSSSRVIVTFRVAIPSALQYGVPRVWLGTGSVRKGGAASREGADDGGGGGGHGDDEQQGCAEDQGDGGGGQAGEAGVDREATARAAERLGDHEGGEQRRGQVLEGRLGPRRERAVPDQQRAGRLGGHGGQPDRRDRDPDGGHERLAPTRHARLAAMIGTPGPATASSARNSAGKAASRPSEAGSATRSPASAPTAVPPTQPTASSRPAPTSRCRSIPPSRWAIAQDSSTTSWAASARRHHGPSRVEAAGSPIGP